MLNTNFDKNTSVIRGFHTRVALDNFLSKTYWRVYRRINLNKTGLKTYWDVWPIKSPFTLSMLNIIVLSAAITKWYSRGSSINAVKRLLLRDGFVGHIYTDLLNTAFSENPNLLVVLSVYFTFVKVFHKQQQCPCNVIIQNKSHILS